MPIRVLFALALALPVAGCELVIDINDDDDEPDAGPPQITDASPFFDTNQRLCEVTYFDIGVAGSLYRDLGGLPYNNARTRCLQDGADLVSINSANEFFAVQSFIQSLPTHTNCNSEPCAWVGLEQDLIATTPEELWSWRDGTQAEITWATTQPDDLDGNEDGEQNCAMLDGLFLRDESCSIATFSVCECQI